MVQVLRLDDEILDSTAALDQIVVIHRGSHLLERDRKVLVLHLPRQRLRSDPPRPRGP